MDCDLISKPAHESDEDLALRAGQGSLAAFDALALRYERRVYSFLRRRCRNHDDLEDLTQSTFVEAWRSITRYSPRWRFSTWLFTIATRQLTGWLRRADVHQRALRRMAESSRDGDADDPFEISSVDEQRGNIWTVVERTLDPIQQTALWLRYAESFSIAEVARIMGRSPVTTRVILFRARQTLRTAMEALETADSASPSTKSRSAAMTSHTNRRKVSHAATE